MKRVLAALLFLLAMCLAAWAEDGVSSTSEIKAPDHAAAPAKDGPTPPKGEKPEEGKSDKKPADTGGLFASRDNLVPLPTVIAPVLIKDRLGAHLYLFLAALTETASDAQTVKTKLPYVQDAMVRDVYLHAVALDSVDQAPDTAALLARLKDVINTAVGEPLVTELQVGRIDTAPF